LSGGVEGPIDEDSVNVEDEGDEDDTDDYGEGKDE
jgi:hypothetical protein